MSVTEEQLEKEIQETVDRMRAFGIKRCHKCNVRLHVDYHARRGPCLNREAKYYCITCDDRKWNSDY